MKTPVLRGANIDCPCQASDLPLDTLTAMLAQAQPVKERWLPW